MSDRVGLFVAGVQKAGTTSLDAYLRLHPGLAGPSVKETHVFDDETQDWSEPPDERLDSYYPLAARKQGLLRFEATPITSFWPSGLERVRSYNGQARIIIILRDPIERAWSHWSMERHRGAEDLDFAQAIRDGRRRMTSDECGPALRAFSYVERGFYAAQIRRARRLFPDRQLLFLEYARLFADVPAALSRIAGFADLPAFPEVPRIRANSNPRPGETMSPEDIAYLQEVFRTDAQEAVALAGIEAAHWLTFRTH
ncbi:sulfotransferase family protein [Bradyrhizobium sp. HKCCYLS2038]|uniref:sulfotransferase family protein n=1 Tax=unclassified Bradyrhizobium TaxID=2631580 RepID=UPI003EBE38C3